MKDFNDDLIWKTIGENEFCAFKWKTLVQNFCKNELNVTGFCSKQSCPLSNSKYATVVEKDGIFLLYQKDSRFLNFPEMMWKKTILSRNFIKAIQQIDLRLAFWPKFFIYRVKQKLTKLTQSLIRNRIFQIRSEAISERKIPLHIKEKNEEFKKLSKIKIEKIIEHELINRLNIGVYGNMYPVSPIQKWKKVQNKRISGLSKMKLIGEFATH